MGEGEASSSTLDIESAEHVRYTPDVDQVTMPLMSFVTSGSETTAGETATWTGVSLLWEDMELQPVFATPNFFEGGPDHRMALRGKTIRATIHVGSGPLEEEILWAVRKRALPAPPKAPRDWPEQKALCLAALNGPLKTEEGWGHCVGPRWPHRPFADQASTLWRLTGEVPPLEKIDMGGSHIPNDAIFFVTGRAKQWRDYWRNVSKGILNSQQQEGSFRYKGKYLKGHFEDTASGFCAQKAKVLLEYAWLTGDMEALVGGVKTLESMKRFRTPRGAQTWELSLHTPDILASAYLVWAYVRGYQLTGEADYLEQARRWALTGLPFVYQWGRYPVMVYSTTAVYGATNWVAPNWMGLPVQWCGTVYAYGLLLLAEHDRTVDWRRVAEGILTAAEQMQYTEGNVGCLPDSFHLKGQRRNPADINPCALVSLRRRLAGEIDSLAVGTDGIHRVTAPFPVMVEDDRAMIQGQAGLTYQILIDGERIVEITSQGRDVVSLIEGAPESKDN